MFLSLSERDDKLCASLSNSKDGQREMQSTLQSCKEETGRFVKHEGGKCFQSHR